MAHATESFEHFRIKTNPNTKIYPRSGGCINATRASLLLVVAVEDTQTFFAHMEGIGMQWQSKRSSSTAVLMLPLRESNLKFLLFPLPLLITLPSSAREQQPKKPWSPKEQEYLDKMAAAPIIYKRIPEQEFYPSVGCVVSALNLHVSFSSEGFFSDVTCCLSMRHQEVP